MTNASDNTPWDSLRQRLINYPDEPKQKGENMTENQIYKQIVERLAEIDDDIAKLRQQHLMLRVDIQILLEKKCLKNL